MNNLYYTPPEDKIFKEVQEKALSIWKEMNSHSNYENEKIERIKNLENIRDNMMYIVGMFDPNNQRVLAGKLSTEAKKAIHDRIEAGGGIVNMFTEL